jgi:hypothetical protein
MSLSIMPQAGQLIEHGEDFTHVSQDPRYKRCPQEKKEVLGSPDHSVMAPMVPKSFKTCAPSQKAKHHQHSLDLFTEDQGSAQTAKR